MEKQEAILKIQEFQKIINNSNRIFISSKQMLAIGFGLLCIPILELTMDNFTFGKGLGQNITPFFPGIKAVLYGSIFWSFGKLFPNPKPKTLNPIIKKTFGIQVPFVAAIIAAGIGLGFTNNRELVYPIVFILLGIFYNLLGRFSNNSLSIVSWLYIIAGPLYMYLISFNIPHLWTYFIVFHALTCIFIGMYTKKIEAGTVVV